MTNTRYAKRLTALPSSQNGVALLTILILVVIVTMLAVTMLAKQNRMVRETSVLVRQDIIQTAALAGEKQAIALLQKDATVNKTDSVKDAWAKPSKPFKIEQATVSYTVEDLSGKYNINNLQYSGKVSPNDKKFFERLLAQLGLAKTLVHAIIDWQDSDDNPDGKDGERDFYAANDVKIANQDFQSIQELRNVKGMTSNAFQALQPYIVAIPVYTKININSAEFPVLAALGKDVNSQSVMSWQESRKDSQPIQKVSELFSQMPFNGISDDAKKAVEPLLSVESQLFLIKTRVEYDGKTSYLTSYAFKNEGAVTVYQRDFSNVAPATTSVSQSNK